MTTWKELIMKPSTYLLVENGICNFDLQNFIIDNKIPVKIANVKTYKQLCPESYKYCNRILDENKICGLVKIDDLQNFEQVASINEPLVTLNGFCYRTLLLDKNWLVPYTHTEKHK